MIKIKVKLSETEEIELTVKQAKKLHEELNTMFKDNDRSFQPYIYTPIFQDYPEPNTPYYNYPVITCNDDEYL